MKNKNLNLLHKTEITLNEKLFKTGVPVTFRYIRGTTPAPNFGSLYQQDIEPAGRYLIFNEDPGELRNDMESGTVTFNNPLVIELNTNYHDKIYNETSWKSRLTQFYGKKGKSLSRAIKKDGYDSIVTISMSHRTNNPLFVSEIVDLTMFT